MFIKFVSVYTVYFHNTNRLIIFYYSNIITCSPIIIIWFLCVFKDSSKECSKERVEVGTGIENSTEIVINDVEIGSNNNIVSLK